MASGGLLLCPLLANHGYQVMVITAEVRVRAGTCESCISRWDIVVRLRQTNAVRPLETLLAPLHRCSYRLLTEQRATQLHIMVGCIVLDSLSCEAHKPSRPKLFVYEVGLRGMDEVCLHARYLPRATAEDPSPIALDRGVCLFYKYSA
jgi:hypothetical protein